MAIRPGTILRSARVIAILLSPAGRIVRARCAPVAGRTGSTLGAGPAVAATEARARAAGDRTSEDAPLRAQRSSRTHAGSSRWMPHARMYRTRAVRSGGRHGTPRARDATPGSTRPARDPAFGLPRLAARALGARRHERRRNPLAALPVEVRRGDVRHARAALGRDSARSSPRPPLGRPRRTSGSSACTTASRAPPAGRRTSPSAMGPT
jgi:hypothetical protein